VIWCRRGALLKNGIDHGCVECSARKRKYSFGNLIVDQSVEELPGLVWATAVEILKKRFIVVLVSSYWMSQTVWLTPQKAGSSFPYSLKRLKEAGRYRIVNYA